MRSKPWEKEQARCINDECTGDNVVTRAKCIEEHCSYNKAFKTQNLKECTKKHDTAKCAKE